MADLSLAQREGLKAKQFAIPQRKAKKIGVAGEIQGESKGKYPIPDLKRARNALARVSQHGTPAEREAVRKKVYAKYPQLREGFEERHGESPTSKENVKMKEQGDITKEAMMAGFFDELEKISSRIKMLREGAEKAIQAAGGRMTPQAQKLHQAAWRHQQATKAALAPRLKAYQAAQGRMAKKPQQGFFSRIFGGGQQPALAGA
jgi:hypothetical protein